MNKVGSNDGNFGGVNVNPAEIKSKKVVVDDAGNKRFIIEFKNGVKASYMDTKNNNASLTSVFAGENYVTSNNVTGLELEGSNKKDIISITGGSIINVDVSKDKTGDYVSVQNSKAQLARSVLNNAKVGFGDIKVSKQDEVNLQNTKNIQKREN